MSNAQFNILREMPLAKLLTLPKEVIHLLILEYPMLNKRASINNNTNH